MHEEGELIISTAPHWINVSGANSASALQISIICACCVPVAISKGQAELDSAKALEQLIL